MGQLAMASVTNSTTRYSCDLMGRVVQTWQCISSACGTTADDDFNRLSGIKNSSGQATYSYVYDRYGNRWQQNALQGGSGFNPTFNAATNQLVSSNSVAYTYDAAGNMTYDAFTGHHLTYDAEGNILQMDAGQSTSWSFVFDALNHRVRAQYSGGISEAVFDIAGRITSGWSAPTTPSESHVFADGQQLALRSGDGNTYFVHQNWMNTDRVHTDLNGATGATYTSLPFGDGGSANVTENYARWDFQQFGTLDADYWDSTYHAQYRNYSELQGRWTSPDPYDGSYSPSNPQSFNRYAYVLNNPLSFTDPSGLDSGYDCGDFCTGVIATCDDDSCSPWACQEYAYCGDYPTQRLALAEALGQIHRLRPLPRRPLQKVELRARFVVCCHQGQFRASL